MSALPPIPRHWSVDQMERELARARRYAQDFGQRNEPLSEDFYRRQSEQLEQAIAAKRKSAGMTPNNWPAY